MGKSSLFVGWATLLGLSLYFAWATRELRSDGREAVAAVQKATGSVYQRPASISVYEEVAVGDSLYNDDYISTGARSSVELVLFSGKTLVISENSLVHLTFNVDEAGFGSDIVTLLKGDMLARGGSAASGDRRPGSTKFKVGKNSVSDDGKADIRISRKVDEAEATIKVVSGTARIMDAESKVQEVATNDVVKLASAAPVMKPLAVNPVMNLAAAKMPVIKIAPQSIVADDKLIATLPTTLKSVNLASIKPIETPPPKSTAAEKSPTTLQQSEVNADPEEIPEPVQEKKPQQVKKPPQKIKVAAVSPQAPPPVLPYTVVLRSANPAAFAGPGIYLVRNQGLFAKVTGKPTTENLLSLKKQYGGQFFFQGNAQAFSGKASLKELEGQSIVYAVSAKGIQPIDAKLILSRPVALDLLVDGGYSIFKEKVDLINVGH